MGVPETISKLPKPRLSPSFAAVAATLLGFVIVMSLNIPVRGNFGVRPGGIAPAPTMPHRCLELSYRGRDYPGMPGSLRLTSEVAYPTSGSGPLYRAISGSGGYWHWNPAGPDSIDIAGHRTPTIRIPARGERVTGRVGWYGYSTIWEALNARPDWQVFAREVRCPPAATG
jgi:hypothetical protein